MTILTHILKDTHLSLLAAFHSLYTRDSESAIIHMQDAMMFALSPIISEVSRLRIECDAHFAFHKPTPRTAQMEESPMSANDKQAFADTIRAHIRSYLDDSKSTDEARAAAYTICRSLAATQPDPMKRARLLSITQHFVRGYFNGLEDAQALAQRKEPV